MFCSAIQAPIITSMVVSMSAPRSRRSSTNSIAAPSAMPSSDGQHERQEEVHARQHHPHVHHVGAEAVELAVGEVHHPHDAEDQRQPDAQQRIGAAQDEGVEAMLKELVHRAFLPLPISSNGERVGVRGGNERWSKRLPLTLTLSPR